MNKHAPLEFPSGSFALQDLEKISADVVAADNDADRAKIARDGLAAANRRIDTIATPGLLPDHKIIPVNRVLEEGVDRQLPDGKTETVGRVVVQEEVQVYDPASAAADPDVAPAAAVAAEAAAPPAGEPAQAPAA
jgi:hypothetical protein